MRHLGKTVVAALALMAFGGAAAQEAVLPKAPVPYTQIRPKAAAAPAVAPPRPAVAAAATSLPRQPGGARLATGEAIDPAELESFLDGWMASAMARAHVPGATVSVVQNGQLVLKKGYGFADLNPRRPVDPDRTLFRIGSISKTFTWILLMREVEARRIRLDRPINLYLPEKVRLPGDARDVMVSNLMDHTAGFEDRALGQLFENQARRVRPLDLYLRQERPHQVRRAGVLSSYSNYGTALAGEAVSFVSGKTFERRVEDEITMPLGMNFTTFREPRPERRGLPAAMPQRLRAHVARGYGWKNADYDPHDYEYIGHVAPAGAASSTAGDMSRYMQMLLGDGTWNGVTVFGPQAARAFRSPLRRTPEGINGWAHGFMVFALPGGRTGYGHLGDTIAFHSNMTLVPDLGLGVFVSTNGEAGAELAGSLPGAVVRQFYAAPTVFPRAGSAELTRAAKVFDGYYLTTRRADGGLEGFVTKLVGGVDIKVVSGRLISTRNGEARAWVLDGPADAGRFIAAQGESRMAFRIADGRAQSFRLSNNSETLRHAGFLDRPSTLIGLTALAGFAAVATLVGVGFRNRRELRQNQIQARAGLVQNMQAGLWLVALTLFAIWGSGASDIQTVMYRWPGLMVVTASACALVAAALTLVTIAALPSVWQGGRRVDSWPAGRKVFFTLTVLIYAAFSVLLAMGGALEPWSR